MIKFITLVSIALLMLGCNIKSENVAPELTLPSTTTAPKVEAVSKVSTKVKTVVKTPSLPAGFKEEKKLRPIGANVPATCQEWSDGCNSCSRAGKGQASCTIYTCENKAPFSCLKWQ